MKRSTKDQSVTLAKLLRELQRTGQRLEDMPPAVLREAQKRGFPDMRSIILAPPRIIESLKRPILRDLLVTRIGYCSRAAGHYIPRPEGSFDHIMHYCLAGRGWLRIGKQMWEITPNTALFIPRGVPHTYGADANNPWSIYWIHFTGRQAGEYFNILGVSATQPLLTIQQNKEILWAMHEIEGHMEQVHTQTHLIAASSALARFLGMVQLRHRTIGSAEDGSVKRVQQTVEFMQLNLKHDIPLRELAQLAHLSVSRYVGVFTQQTGCTPIHYFNRMKIQHACRLLSETDMSVRAIGCAIGIEDAYYFSRLFRKLIGVSPRHFRKQHPIQGHRM